MSGPDAGSPEARRFRLALAGIVLLGALIRLRAVFTEFWLDEIVSYDFAFRAASAWEIVARPWSDNNHLLNTLLMRGMGLGLRWEWYRLPAWAAGTLCIPLAAAAGRDRTPAARLLSAFLTAASFVLVQYSSEARGYSLAAFFCLAAHVALERHLRTRERRLLPLFWACAVLAGASHLTAFFVLAALAVRAAAHLWSEERNWRGCAARLAPILVPPGAALALLLAPYLRAEIVGGPSYPVGQVLRQLAGDALGLGKGAAAAIGGALVLGIAAARILHLRRKGDGSWVFYAVAVFVAPAAVLVLNRGLLYPRYLLVPVPFLFVLLGDALAELLRAGPRRRVAAAAALAVFTAGNALAYARFVQVGRGHHLEALRHMARETAGDLITVDVDHPFHVGTMLSYFGDFLPAGKALYPHWELPAAAPPEWFLAHSDEETPPWPPELQLYGRHRYRLEKFYSSKEVYGFDLYVFRRADPGP